MASDTRIVLLTRVRSNDNDGRRTLHFISEGLSARSRRSRVGFVDRAHVPEFDGEHGWFEVERVAATPWSYWRAVRQVDPPSGWSPPPPAPPRTPAQRLGHRS